MSLREEMARYEKLTGEIAEHTPIIRIGAFLDGVDRGIEELEKIKVYNDHILNCGMGKKKSIEFINKFIEHHISELKGEQE